MSPDALAAYRAPRSVPVISLIVLALYAFAEFLLIPEVNRAAPDLGAPLFTAHLATWVASVLGLLFGDPSSALSVACRVVLWAMWLLPIAGVVAIASMFDGAQASWGLLVLGASAVLFGPGIAPTPPAALEHRLGLASARTPLCPLRRFRSMGTTQLCEFPWVR